MSTSIDALLDAATRGTFEMAATAYGYAADRCQAAARGSRSETLWMNRRDRIGVAINDRGLIVRRSPISGGYMVGRPASFAPAAR